MTAMPVYAKTLGHVVRFMAGFVTSGASERNGEMVPNRLRTHFWGHPSRTTGPKSARGGRRRGLTSGGAGRARREDHPDEQCRRGTEDHQDRPDPAQPGRVDEAERAVHRPAAVADERDGEGSGRERQWELDAALVAPESLRPMRDDRHDGHVRGEHAGTDRPAEAEDGEEASTGFGRHRHERPEETGPQADRAEPSRGGRDGATLADPPELEQSVRRHDGADDDAKDEEPEIHIQLSAPPRDRPWPAGTRPH